MLGLHPFSARPVCGLWSPDVVKTLTVTIPTNATNQTGFPYLFSIYCPGYSPVQVIVQQSGVTLPSELITTGLGFAYMSVRLNLSTSSTQTLEVMFR